MTGKAYISMIRVTKRLTFLALKQGNFQFHRALCAHTVQHDPNGLLFRGVDHGGRGGQTYCFGLNKSVNIEKITGKAYKSMLIKSHKKVKFSIKTGQFSISQRASRTHSPKLP